MRIEKAEIAFEYDFADFLNSYPQSGRPAYGRLGDQVFDSQSGLQEARVRPGRNVVSSESKVMEKRDDLTVQADDWHFRRLEALRTPPDEPNDPAWVNLHMVKKSMRPGPLYRKGIAGAPS
jgi:hypothetical protein